MQPDTLTMDELNPRLRAVCDLSIAEVREQAGRHEYDGQIQDLSPDGVQQGLSRLVGAAAAASPTRIRRVRPA